MTAFSPFPFGAVAGASLMTSVANLPAYLVGALAVLMRVELQFSTTRTGLAISAFMAASAVAGPVLGPWVQRLGAARAIRVGASVTGAGMFGIALFARSWGMLVAFLVVGGAANATGQMASNMALAESSSPRHDGLAFGVKQAAVPFATMLAGLSVPLFVGVIGWRWAFVFAAMFAFLIALMAPRFVTSRGPMAGPPAGPAVPRTVDWFIVGWITFAAFCASGVAMSVAVFIVEYAVATGWTAGAAGLLLAACSFVVVAMRVGAGCVVDRRARRGDVPFLLLPAAAMVAVGGVGILSLAIWPGSPALLAVGSVVGLGIGWGWPGLMHLSVISMDRASAAVATGAILFGVFGGGVLLPVVLGSIAERGSYEAAWTVSAGLLAVAAGAFAVAHVYEGRRRRPRPNASRDAPPTSAVCGR